MKRSTPFVSFAAVALSAALATGCSDSASDASAGAGDWAGQPAPGATGVAPAGAQDFGLFRQILEAGQIPHPSTLDAVGFFAEHKLDYPAADCGEDICVHGLLAVQRNLMTGGQCTLLQVGLNSPVDPREMARPPLDLVLALDISGSMRGAPLRAVIDGLIAMVDHLEPEDRVSLVTYDTRAEVVFEDVPGDDHETLLTTFGGLASRGSTNLYDGLFEAFRLADKAPDPARQRRVVLLSDGMATAGFEDAGRMQALATAYARRGVGLTTIGVGTDFDVELMRSLGEIGAGNFYFLENPEAVREVFTEEVQTFLVPVALDVRLEVHAGSHYLVRGAYGMPGFSAGLRSGYAELPALFLAGRQRASDAIEGTGRRGGGGGLFIELMPASRQAEVGEADQVGLVTLSWTDPTSGERREQAVDVRNPHGAGEVPTGGHFTDATVEKGFVMLNLLVGFQLAAELALDADSGTAIGLLRALRGEVAAWLASHDDDDIADDLRYVDLFIANLEARGLNTPVFQPPEPWPQD
ncbi:MAG: VWA domain-containing protein [Myxococcales bacterium]|nr:VWA domain-containing protein [Myxococcales bacterium]